MGHPAAVAHEDWDQWNERMFDADQRPYGVRLLLHHYTSFAGLTGILSTARLRATDVLFCNDRGELTYGWAICDRALGIVDRARFGFFVERVRAGIEHRFGHAVFVACTSEAVDLRWQWQDYADRERASR